MVRRAMAVPAPQLDQPLDSLPGYRRKEGLPWPKRWYVHVCSQHETWRSPSLPATSWYHPPTGPTARVVNSWTYQWLLTAVRGRSRHQGSPFSMRNGSPQRSMDVRMPGFLHWGCTQLDFEDTHNDHYASRRGEEKFQAVELGENHLGSYGEAIPNSSLVDSIYAAAFAW